MSADFRERNVEPWAVEFGRAKQEYDDLVAAGRWRGGPQTLLAAVGVEYGELAMTAGLHWLLRPDGHHGLGASVLSELLAHLGMQGCDPRVGVRVVREERREGTIADLIVYGADWTLIVEAKTFAPEQEDQLDRLFRHWQRAPGARFVFLTRGERRPLTARESGDHWAPLAWSDVARCGRNAIAASGAAAPGVLDYLTTLEVYHRD